MAMFMPHVKAGIGKSLITRGGGRGGGAAKRCCGKGELHLKNEDTDYKRKLFETLERHSDGGVPVGEFILGDAPGPMRFRFVLEGDWKSQVDAALAVTEV
jgi:hypothetical protein